MRTANIGILVVLALLASAPPAARPAETAARPNVIIVLTDDQGFGELGGRGNPVIHTPHIDRLAAQSVSLTNFCVMPVCSPTVELTVRAAASTVCRYSVGRNLPLDNLAGPHRQVIALLHCRAEERDTDPLKTPGCRLAAPPSLTGRQGECGP